MSVIAEDCFVVYVRDKKTRPHHLTERKLVACDSYEQAQMVRRENQAPDRHCIIRYIGPAGGGD